MLRVDAASGWVERDAERRVRLAPVPLKVLLVLIEKQGEVVSRGELFDAVWGEQEVSDDALTRCISDIRTALRPLIDGQNCISTVPKRGYRWALPTEESTDESPKRSYRRVLIGLGYVLAFVVTASAASLFFQRSDSSSELLVAVLSPTTDLPSHADSAARVDGLIRQILVETAETRVLARSAVQTEAGIYPRLFFEHSVRWIIESRISGAQPSLELTIVDARTGLVQAIQTFPIPVDDADLRSTVFEFLTAHLPALGAGSGNDP